MTISDIDLVTAKRFATSFIEDTVELGEPLTLETILITHMETHQAKPVKVIADDCHAMALGWYLHEAADELSCAVPVVDLDQENVMDTWRDLAIDSVAYNIERRLPEGDPLRKMIDRFRNLAKSESGNAPIESVETAVVTESAPKPSGQSWSKGVKWTPERRQAFEQNRARRALETANYNNRTGD